ncbi:MAG TPA: hypothetical protein VGO31_16295 [Microbacteriaceae bacterium]|nr:hypothetical protein [Microbacteriaceae bacterium]
MGLFDRILGREDPEPTNQNTQSSRGNTAPQRSEDEIAVERYQYLLRTAPPETIEKVHIEAFSKLTPEQRDILFQRLSENASPAERPADAQPATLAQAATRAEFQQPGTMTRTLGGGGLGGPSFGSMFGSSLLGTVAGFVIGSAIVSAFMPMDSGADAASGDSSDPNAADSMDAGGAGGTADSAAGDTTAAGETTAAGDATAAGDGWGSGGSDGGAFDGGGDFGGFDGF